MAETENKYAIHEAAREGRTTTIETLLHQNPKLATRLDEDDRTPLHWATAHNHIDCITLLTTARTFDPDAQDASGWTPLMIASSLKDDAGLPAINLLLAKGADPKMSAVNGATALHLAVSKGNLEVVRRLMDAGASVRVRDKRGQIPLHRAAAGGVLPIVRLLVGRGRSPLDGSDVDGCTALHHAVCEGHGDVAVELLRAGADSAKRDGMGRLAVECAPDARVRGFIERAAEREGIDL